MASPTISRKHVRKGGSGGQNIKVFVRCRPQNTAEKNSKSFNCLECCNNREIVVRERPFDKFTKTFAFDRVFGPESKQLDVYKAVAKNCVDEVLSGFNCTIFAYGQTGTGKTFTMEGEHSGSSISSWDDDPLAGIIPRCVNHLFDELRIQKLEFTMRVSFLELYNEELFDLLSPQNDLSKLRLYEDTSRKGSCIIQGLEEVLVRNKANVYEILEKGSNKRQTAATLMNAHSSRSHTVFTVTVHIKENTEDGDELLKTGKLHLVDLAGSENIGRSGAVDKRAREAGNINMSLLTLGRVITSLVEKAPHVPYRESKLTRLLQDALGGRTKTSIIATVSPSAINLEESLSTLDYAHRAKNIQNKPEVNQKLNKKELIGEYSQEIERLRLDLMAMREKSGVYLANENYQEMLQTLETQAQEITEKINYIRSLEEGIETKTNELSDSNSKLDDLAKQLEKMKEMLSETTEVLSCTQKLLHDTSVACDEQKYLVSAHIKTEDKLLNQGKDLLNLADTTTNHVTKLQDKLQRKKTVEETNEELQSNFTESFTTNVNNMKAEMHKSVEEHKKSLNVMSTHLGNCINECQNDVSSIICKWTGVCQNHVLLFKEIQGDFKKQAEDRLIHTQSFSEGKVGEFEQQQLLLKNVESNIFLPAMDKLASLISAEATVMSSVQSAVNGKLKLLNENLEEFVRQQGQLVSTHEVRMQKMLESVAGNSASSQEAFESLCNSLDSKVQDLEDKSKEMEAVLSSVRDIKQGIDKDVADSRLTLPLSLKNLELTTEAAREQVKTYAVDHKKNYAEHMSSARSQVSEILASVEEYYVKSEENVQHLGEERCGLESAVSQYINETNSFLDGMTTDLKEFEDNTEKTQKKSIKDNETTVQKAIQTLEKDQENMTKEVKSEHDRLEQDLSSLKEKCHILSTELQAFADSQSSELNSQEMELIELFSNKLVQDIPTGQTPARQDYKFSRLLSKTSPHEIILERFRKGTASNMSKIPLPSFGDDTEDEIFSPSLSCSQVSSADSSRLEDDLIESRSRSGSVTDVHSKSRSGSVTDVQSKSRSGSTTDISLLSNSSKNEKDVFAVPSCPPQPRRENSSLSRSSSTSSIPDMKDKENNLSQKGSAKKRGLRHPSVVVDKNIGQEVQPRTRRILGSQN